MRRKSSFFILLLSFLLTVFQLSASLVFATEQKQKQEESKMIPEEEKMTKEEQEDQRLYLSTDTLVAVNQYSYHRDSITRLTRCQRPFSTLKKMIGSYGSFLGNEGMPYSEYIDAMLYEWRNAGENNQKPEQISIDLNKSYTYEDCVKIMKNLSRYPGVNLYVIGMTTQKREIYAIEIDMKSESPKETIILTGGVHARETGGSMFILKQLCDLLFNAKSKSSQEILSNNKIVAVPFVNPDGREGVAFQPTKFTYSDGQLWKAYANGTDGNRNMPGLQWGQILKGNKRATYYSSSAKNLYYPGDYAGSCPETKAMIKFLYHYVAVDQARLHIDYHQQGRITYAGKPWQTSEQLKRCQSLSNYILGIMNSGNTSKYHYRPECLSYGLMGEGSTLTDFSVSVAVGAKFSPAYGFFVFTDGKKEYPLIQIRDLDTTSVKGLKEVNPKFATMTLEIGSSSSCLGYSSTARKLQAKEYSAYHFDKLLGAYAKFIHK